LDFREQMLQREPREPGSQRGEHRFGLLFASSDAAAKQDVQGRRKGPRRARTFADLPTRLVDVDDHLQRDDLGDGVILLIPVGSQLA